MVKKLEKVEDKLKSETEKKLCVVCMEADKNAIFLPCGHISCCMACAQSVKNSTKKCPVCRGTIQSINKVFQ